MTTPTEEGLPARCYSITGSSTTVLYARMLDVKTYYREFRRVIFLPPVLFTPHRNGLGELCMQHQLFVDTQVQLHSLAYVCSPHILSGRLPGRVRNSGHDMKSLILNLPKPTSSGLRNS